MRFPLTAACLVLFAVLPGHAASEPLFPNSVVSNDLDFIRTDDRGVFSCIGYKRETRAEMPDKRGGELMADGVFSWSAQFKDGTSIEVWVHPDVGSRDAARKLALHAAYRVGKLPTFMRSRLNHVVIHEGNETAFSEDTGRFFVLYSKNMATRLRNNDLEETVFHESVHATLDVPMSASAAWKQAQRTDGDFVTSYARDNPDQEDMAESALFAWALLIHPGRLPKSVEEKVRTVMPNRLAFFRELFVEGKPTFYRVGPAKSC